VCVRSIYVLFRDLVKVFVSACVFVLRFFWFFFLVFFISPFVAMCLQLLVYDFFFLMMPSFLFLFFSWGEEMCGYIILYILGGGG
jgi:hypothetical protein